MLLEEEKPLRRNCIPEKATVQIQKLLLQCGRELLRKFGRADIFFIPF